MQGELYLKRILQPKPLYTLRKNLQERFFKDFPLPSCFFSTRSWHFVFDPSTIHRENLAALHATSVSNVNSDFGKCGWFPTDFFISIFMIFISKCLWFSTPLSSSWSSGPVFNAFAGFLQGSQISQTLHLCNSKHASGLQGLQFISLFMNVEKRNQRKLGKETLPKPLDCHCAKLSQVTPPPPPRILRGPSVMDSFTSLWLARILGNFGNFIAE